MTPNEVVQKAYAYLGSVLGGDFSRVSNVRVEELQKDKENNWLVTLSYEALGDFPFEKKREYKEFKIVDATGVVEYMKIKKV